MRWSYSRLGCYEKCGAQFYYKYVENLPSDSGKAANRGTDLHALMEIYIKTALTKLPPELEFYQNFLDELRASSHSILPEHKLAVNENWEGVEWEDETAWGRGILDLLVVPAGTRATLYDWKTGKEYDDHYEQKELYASLVFANFRDIVEVDAVHTYLDLRRNTSRTYHRDQAPAMMQRWTERANKMLQEDYTPSPGYYCKWCSYSRGKGGKCKF